MNQAFLDRDPDQTESLIQSLQMRVFGFGVDDFARRNLNPSSTSRWQSIKVETHEFGMNVCG